MKKESLPKGFTCECGTFHKFSAYVFAHWTDDLRWKCDCGRVYMIQEGAAELIEGPQPTPKGAK